MSNPIAKCISMGGPGPQYFDTDPHDYRLWGNDDYITNLSNTRWVKVWIDWAHLQPNQPSSWQDSWNALNTQWGGQIQHVDRQLKACNDDGRATILTVYQRFPTWTSTQQSRDASAAWRFGRSDERKFPDDVSASGGWGWFIAHLLARYKLNAPVNNPGPRPGALYGNPYGAYVNLLEIVNEPNYLFWPQGPSNWSGCVVAQMMQTAEAYAYAYGWGAFQGILGPATWDGSDTPPPNSEDPYKTLDWKSFSQTCLGMLQNWQPRAYVGWSHHNYGDVKRPDYAGPGTSRVSTIRSLLYNYNWRGNQNSDRWVWLTEGGYDTPDQYLQQSAVVANYSRMINTPDVPIWTYHDLHDTGPDYNYGMRDDFIYGPPPRPGPPKTIWSVWRNLN